MIIALLDNPNLVFDHVRRFTTSICTQMMTWVPTPRIDDLMLLQKYDGDDKWAALIAAGFAKLLDVFPFLRSLPAGVRPLCGHVGLQKNNLDLSFGLWQDVKEKIEEKMSKANPASIVSRCSCPLLRSGA